jgi:hypothetical protein
MKHDSENRLNDGRRITNHISRVRRDAFTLRVIRSYVAANISGVNSIVAAGDSAV